MLNKVYLYDLDYFLLSLLTAFADKEWDLKLSGNGLQDELHRPGTHGTLWIHFSSNLYQGHG